MIAFLVLGIKLILNNINKTKKNLTTSSLILVQLNTC